jgi:hypothetical protein
VNSNWPVAIKIYDTEIDLPDIGPLESDPTIGYRKRERLDMVETVHGVPGGPGSVERETTQTSP